MAYGWDQMRKYTNKVADNAAANHEAHDELVYKTNRFHNDQYGYIRSDGTIPVNRNPENGSFFGRMFDRIFGRIDRFLNGDPTKDFSPQGIPGIHNYEASWLGGTNGPIAGFINLVSKAHDFMNGWNYNAVLGESISRGAAFDSLYDIYSLAMMPPAGAYTAAAFSPATVGVFRRHY